MKIIFSLLSFVIGIVLSVHLSMNSQVGALLKNPRMGNAIFWTIGAVAAIIIGVTSSDAGAVFDRMNEVPMWLWTAGILGASLVFGIAWIIPQFGAGATFIVMIAGQVIAGLVLSHYGVLGSALEPINWMKVFGALLLIAGASIVTFS